MSAPKAKHSRQGAVTILLVVDNTRIEHLKMIQAVITRMGQNSFSLKGWAVTLLSALLGLAAAGSNVQFALIAYVPAVVFWGLDTYYLYQERLFRKLYDRVRSENGKSDFSMNTEPVADQVGGLAQVALSRTILPFYGVVLLVIIIATFLVDR